MTSRILCCATVVLSLSSAFIGAQPSDSSNGRVLPSDDDIRQILRERVDVQGKGVGQPITFLDVATHTSGLPLMPDGISSLNELVTLNRPLSDGDAPT